MPQTTFTCPRCFFTAPTTSELRFCPRCGLRDAAEAAADTSVLEVRVGSRLFHVHERIAIGSICTLYRCRFDSGSKPTEGIFKIARDPRTNDLVANEALILRRLHAADRDGRFGPFLPIVEESFAYGEGSPDARRHANVLRMHAEIHSPDELYTLDEVRQQFPAGLGGRDVAWIWRRLLNILGFAHSTGVIHGAVLPMHVLIEPAAHKLLLIDWCCAVHESDNRHPITILSGGYAPWYKRDNALRQPPTPNLDIAFAARCMIELLGGDPLRAEFPPKVEAGLQRHFERCLSGAASLDAWKLLEDFDRLIDALWGPRKFQVLTMPPKRGS